jgi:glycosyltransferase involved in cell wall biosynthesis
MPLVSIVIPAYNAGGLIRQTLQSVMASTEGDFEVIVVNDGSSDNTAEAASGLDPRIKVVSRANAGMSATRNFGVAQSDSEFVALLDADDLWHPEKLRFQLQALNARPEFGFCFTGFTWWWGEDTPEFMKEMRQGSIDPAMCGWVYHHLILDNHALPSSVMLRRSAWNQLGPFLCDNQQTDDWEYLVRASQSFRFVRLQESFVLYRQLSSSLSKRTAPKNFHELMRVDLIRRFGLQSPDGTEVDRAKLAAFQYKGHSNFADMHCARGDLSLGLRNFANLLRHGPQRGETLTRLGKSLFRRVFPKAS